ncbi:universal stress protein [Halomicroarcula limicola]|uniref:Universal stress protein n=1 Tax=Haloarcula limicola TaxID=1429915 RepID=A0A8J8C550_9EURY|nr:universal stress protein [Halomicroarcula limicola]MBV0925947.1 universal stress protein [Halomicroarcula limicola]
MTIETILLPVSDSDGERVHRLADIAAEMAAPTGATVVVAHAIPKDTDGVTPTIPPISGGSYPQLLSEPEYNDLLDEYSADEIAAKHETVQSVRSRFEDRRIEYDIRGAVGEPDEALLALASEIDADQIVVGGRRRTPADKVVFGSLAQTLLLQAPCPVTFVRDS